MDTLLSTIDPKAFLFDTTLFSFLALAIGLLIYSGMKQETQPATTPFLRVNSSYFQKSDLIASTIVVGLFASLAVFIPYLLPELLKAPVPEEGVELKKSTGDIEMAILTLISILIPFVVTSTILLILLGQKVNILTAFGIRSQHWGRIVLVTFVSLFAIYGILGLLVTNGYPDLIKQIFGETEQQAAVKQLLEAKSPMMKSVMIFAAIVVAPIFEEIIFRGCFQVSVKKYTGPIFAILISSMLFSLIHGSAANAVPLFIVGAILAIAYEVSGSLTTCVITHAIFNSIQVVGMLVQPYLPAQ